MLLASVQLNLLFLTAHVAARKCLVDTNNSLSQKVTLRILQRDWTSHKLISCLAAILLREEMMYDVVMVNETNLPNGSAESLAKGKFDADLEHWGLANREDMYRRWVGDQEDGLAEHLMSHEAIGEEGIYVPKYVVDANPQTQFYPFYAKAAAQDQFSKHTFVKGEPDADKKEFCKLPAWNCTDLIWRPPVCAAISPTGNAVADPCRAQVLKGPLGWNQGFIEQLIANKELPVSVAYTEWPTTLKKVWNAYANWEEVLFYWWTPNDPILGLESSLFTRVQFPPKTDECETPGRDPKGRAACESNPVILQKLASPHLASSVDARNFVISFSLTEDDLRTLFEEWVRAKEDAPRAACNWLVRSGRKRWQSWVFYSVKKPRVSFTVGFHDCWPWFWIQLFLLLLGLTFSTWSQYFRRCWIACQAHHKKKRASVTSSDVIQREESADSLQREEHSLESFRGRILTPRAKGPADMFSDVGRGTRNLFDTPQLTQMFDDTLDLCQHQFSMIREPATPIFKFRKIVKSKKLGFMTYNRTLENFISSNGTYIATDCGQLFFRCETLTNTKLTLIWYLLQSAMIQVVYLSLWSALAISIWASLVAIAERVNEQNDEESPFSRIHKPLLSIVTNFGYLATVMSAWKVYQHINRWMEWLGSAGSIAGRLGDLALIVGSLEGVNHPDRRERNQIRRIQYHFYRYMNLVHVLAYLGLEHRVGESPESLCEELEHRGLLEKEEKMPLLKTQNGGLHCTVLTWMAVLWHSQIESQQVEGDNHPNSQNFMQKLQDLRGTVGTTRCMLDYSNPELYRGMMYMITWVWLLLVAIAFPIDAYEKEKCLQWKGVLVSISYIFLYHGLLVMQDILARSPFDPQGECVNVDYLLCSTDEMLFHMVRAGYDPDEKAVRPSACIYAHPKEHSMSEGNSESSPRPSPDRKSGVIETLEANVVHLPIPVENGKSANGKPPNGKSHDGPRPPPLTAGFSPRSERSNQAELGVSFPPRPPSPDPPALRIELDSDDLGQKRRSRHSDIFEEEDGGQQQMTIHQRACLRPLIKETSESPKPPSVVIE